MTNPNISFPDGFKALRKLPGYYWNSVDNRVYSLKSGVLKKLKVNYPSNFMVRHHGWENEPYYRFSVCGKQKIVRVKWIPDRILDDYVVEVADDSMKRLGTAVDIDRLVDEVLLYNESRDTSTLVGLVMKQAGGKANPSTILEILQNRLKDSQ